MTSLNDIISTTPSTLIDELTQNFSTLRSIIIQQGYAGSNAQVAAGICSSHVLKGLRNGKPVSSRGAAITPEKIKKYIVLSEKKISALRSGTPLDQFRLRTRKSEKPTLPIMDMETAAKIIAKGLMVEWDKCQPSPYDTGNEPDRSERKAKIRDCLFHLSELFPQIKDIR